MTDLDLRCECGKVHGRVRNVSPKTGTHAVCYCNDCQAFARFLGRADIMDEWGGTDIFQFAPATLRLEHEPGALACLRLSEKGLHRWYCAHCKTPIGNTIPKVPFVGMPHLAFDFGAGRAAREAACGLPIAHVQQKCAKAKPPYPENNVRVIARAARRFLRWYLTRQGRPTPFFDERNEPVVTPRVLSPAERRAL